jgi:acyl-CoA dehydrogenase
VELVRSLPVFGYTDQHGHGEIVFRDVRVPVSNLLGQEGDGFAIAQARLGPGRVHHCMRLMGMAQRGLALMVERARTRTAFGRPLAEHGMVERQVAEARIAIEAARLLVLKTAWLIDTVGGKAAATEIAAIKVLAPRVACQVLDDAIQVFGAAGVSDDVPLAAMYAGARTLRIADGPDEVHLRSVARRELRRPR